MKNEQGIYDTVEVYRAKKDETPICVLKGDEMAVDVLDECIDKGKKVMAPDITSSSNSLKTALSADFG